MLLPDGPRYVGLAPGTSTRIRCWPLDRFVSLAKWVQSRGWHPVLLLGPNKQDLREPRRSSRTPSVARHRPAVERGGHHGYGPRSSASRSGHAACVSLRTHQSQALGPARPASHPCHLLAPLWRARDGAHPADRRLRRGRRANGDIECLLPCFEVGEGYSARLPLLFRTIERHDLAWRLGQLLAQRRRAYHLDVAPEAEDRDFPGRGPRRLGRSTCRGAQSDGTPAAAEPELARRRCARHSKDPPAGRRRTKDEPPAPNGASGMTRHFRY